jgi:NAD(P)H dehydrogenase (quinone)
MTTIAITGASGNLGRATLGYLLKGGVAPASVVPLVRDLAKARELDAPGSDARRADYTDVASLERAFSRIDTLLFISSSALGEERMRHHANVVQAARSAGVAHIVYTSVLKPSASAKFPASPGHLHTEQLIRESGIPCTLFRNNLYSDIVPDLFAGATETGVLTHCAGTGRVGFVARDDIAAALAGVLARGDRPGRVHAITAREAYSLTDVAAALGQAAGKTVQYHDVSSDELRESLAERGVPGADVAWAVAVGEAIAAGEFDASSQDLEELLGRAPVDLSAFLSRALNQR